MHGNGPFANVCEMGIEFRILNLQNVCENTCGIKIVEKKSASVYRITIREMGER